MIIPLHEEEHEGWSLGSSLACSGHAEKFPSKHFLGYSSIQLFINPLQEIHIIQ